MFHSSFPKLMKISFLFGYLGRSVRHVSQPCRSAVVGNVLDTYQLKQEKCPCSIVHFLTYCNCSFPPSDQLSFSVMELAKQLRSLIRCWNLMIYLSHLKIILTQIALPVVLVQFLQWVSFLTEIVFYFYFYFFSFLVLQSKHFNLNSYLAQVVSMMAIERWRT